MSKRGKYFVTGVPNWLKNLTVLSLVKENFVARFAFLCGDDIYSKTKKYVFMN